MELGTLLGLNLAKLQEAADDWKAVATKLGDAAGDVEECVIKPLVGGQRWEGKDADEATKASRGIQMDIRAVAKEAEAVQKYLDSMATGDGDGFGNGNLKKAQDQARDLVQEAIGHGLTVDPDGTVRWEVMRAPGKLSHEEQQQEKAKQAECDRLGKEVKKVLKTAEALDMQIKAALLVIFGTEETFRTENRSRRDGDPGFGDRLTEAQMYGVAKYMDGKDWDDAANLLNHYLEGSGEPYEVDTGRMLNDLPTFRKDVDTSLAGLKKQPDGPVSTNWKSSSSGTKGNEKVMNWYYGLHHFEYRVVGHKTGDQVTYQVEVRKRYDWGVPSEHRGDLVAPAGVVDVEQPEVARLNQTRQAKDFDVHGRTGMMTTR